MTETQLTPVAIESKLKSLVTELSKAQQALAHARDVEVETRHDLNRARRRAMLSASAPRVARDGYTAAERDAWVEDQVDAEQVLYDRAVVARESAQDHLRVVRDQASVVQSLGVFVRQAYELAGHAD
jgi:hypothetical protein